VLKNLVLKNKVYITQAMVSGCIESKFCKMALTVESSRVTTAFDGLFQDLNLEISHQRHT
jgi:hypothetical protein